VGTLFVLCVEIVVAFGNVVDVVFEFGVVDSDVKVVVAGSGVVRSVVEGVVTGRSVADGGVDCTAVCSIGERVVEACASSLLTLWVVVVPGAGVAETTIAVAGVLRVEAATVRTEAQQGRGRGKDRIAEGANRQTLCREGKKVEAHLMRLRCSRRKPKRKRHLRQSLRWARPKELGMRCCSGQMQCCSARSLQS